MSANHTKNLNRLTGRNPLAYLGVEPISPPEQLIATTPPPTNITANMSLGTQWLVANPGAEEVWELVNITGNTAKWVALYPSMLQVLTLVNDVGSAVETGGTINLLGDANITTTGAGNTTHIDLNPSITLTGTLTLSALGAGVMQTNAGGVVTSSAPLSIALGGTNATTMATTNGVNYFDGSRIVTTGPGVAAQVLTSNGGAIAPSFQDVSSLGFVSELSADTGFATPVSGIIDIAGGNNISTTGSGNTITVNVFGTTNNAVQVGNGSGSLSSISVGTNGQLLIGATGSNPSFSALTSSASTLTYTGGAGSLNIDITAPLSIAYGGTNATSMTNVDGVVYYNGTKLNTTLVGTAAQVLTSNGAGFAPTFQNASATGAITELTADSGSALPSGGIIDIAGGNNITTAAAGNTVTVNVSGTTNHAIQVGNATNSLSSLAVGINGQVLLGSTGANPSFGTLTSSASTLTYTTGAGSLNIDVTAPLPIAYGGTNATSMANTDGVVYYDGTKLNTTTVGTATYVLTSNGPGFAPTFQAAPVSGAVTELTADSGSATPLAGIIDIAGGNNITTSGATDVITINVSGTTNHAVQVGNSTNSLTSLTVGTNGQLLIGSTGANPVFAAPTSSASTLTYTAGAGTLNIDITAPVAIAYGGTNATSMATTDGVVYYDGTRLVTTAVGTAGNLLTSNGAGLAPTYQSLGTTNHAVLVGNSSGNVSSLTVGTNGQVLIGSTGANPVFATLTSSGGSITYTTGAGSLNLDITAPVSIANGGTNATSMANTFGVNYYDGSKINTTGVGTATYVLTSNGAGNAPTFQTASASGATTSFAADTGTATPSSGVITIHGGSNMNTSATGSTVTINLNNSPSVSGSLTAGTGITATTGNIAASSGDITASGSLTAGTKVLSAAGTVGAPSYTFTGNTATGLYAPASGQFSLSAAGVDKVKYDGSSVLVASIYRFSAELTGSNQTISPSTTATVVFNTAVISSANYNTSTGVYTAPVTGTYLVAVNLLPTSSVQPDVGNALITKNGTGLFKIGYFYSTANSDIQSGGTFLVPLTAGDSLRIDFNGATGTTTIFAGYATFGMHLLSTP